MKNADYDLKVKSELELSAAFEGSGVANDESSDVIDYHVVDDNFEEQDGSADI